MLFTRCPGCQTTFRITADTLRVANGAVRCGSCATVFSAFSGLQQNALENGLQADDEFLSPTVQTQELAGIEEIASPDVGAAPASADELEDGPEAAVTEPSVQDAAPEPVEHDSHPDIEDGIPDAPILDEQARVEEELAQEAPTPDAPLEFEEDTALKESAFDPQLERGDEAVASESSAKLQFEVPTDEWALLLSEIEQSTEANAETDSEKALSSTDDETRDDETDPDDVDFWDVGDSAATESWTEIELSSEDNTANELVAVGAPEVALGTDEQIGEPLADAETEADVAALLEAEPDISAEQVDATLSADADVISSLEASLPARLAGGRRLRLWAGGSVALALVLALQVVHHFRTPLAEQSLLGPLLQSAYGAFGAELVPAWNLEQYEILNWVASEAGAGNLRIAAQIRNSGPRAQPYPHIRLELKDRWEVVVGSRVFDPVEYLQSDTASTDLMVAGVTVPADLTVVDPGEDAYGFELDVCLQSGADLLSCASERVFE